eukprot:5925528-Amphidinium_carterae.1
MTPTSSRQRSRKSTTHYTPTTQKLESQLQLKHVTKLHREQPLVFLGRQIHYYGDHSALSKTSEYYKSLLSLYKIKRKQTALLQQEPKGHRLQLENRSAVKNIQLIARLWANYFGC